MLVSKEIERQRRWRKFVIKLLIRVPRYVSFFKISSRWKFDP